MKKALVCSNEPAYGGWRIAQVEPAENIFLVATPLSWIDCNDDVVADLWYYDTNVNKIIPIPERVLIKSNTQSTNTSSKTF